MQLCLGRLSGVVVGDKHFLVDGPALVPLGHVVDAVHLLNEDSGLLVQLQHFRAKIVGKQPQASAFSRMAASRWWSDRRKMLPG